MNIIRKYKRKLGLLLYKYYNGKRRHRLKNNTMSLIANNCNGAFILHDLGMKFNSPFVNLWLYPSHFLEFVENINVYKNLELSFIKEPNINYPIGKLGEVKIYFQHYHSEQEAKDKWEQRMKRLNLENLFVMMTERDGCTYEDLLRFDQLPFDNKVVFTHKLYPNIKSSFYIKGFENQVEVGNLYEFMGCYSKKFYDQFDYVDWFNSNQK